MSITLLVFAVLAGTWAYAWRQQLVRRRTIARLDGTLQRVDGVAESTFDLDMPAVSTFPPRYRAAIPIVGLATIVGLRFGLSLPLQIAITAGCLLAVLTHILEAALADRKTLQMEMQLTEALDLMVSSLRAGAALLASFEASLHEARTPLRPYLEEVIGRVRLGDDPREVIAALTTQVPLETFRLFATSLSVNWEVGGSLASTLATVGRTIRDRIELYRRVRTQGIEANVSVALVMLIAYALAFLMWRTSPERMEAFVQSAVGTDLVAFAIGLQAAGLIWMTRLSRGDF